jgi:hypothetical protein
MSDEIGKLLKTEDDSELCDELFKRLVKRYGDDLDVSKCREEHRVVLLVWHASGIIDNGGFQYLFEGNFNGDPHFAKTAAAFRTINVRKCAEAVEEALKLFPDSKPPTDTEIRLRDYQSQSAAERWAIDKKFFSESRHIPSFLAKYIRKNEAEFRGLK